jgi:hypothetical protein
VSTLALAGKSPGPKAEEALFETVSDGWSTTRYSTVSVSCGSASHLP